MNINPNHFQSQINQPLISQFTGQMYSRISPNILNIVIGPPRCGKSTYIHTRAQPNHTITHHLTRQSLQGVHGKTFWTECDSERSRSTIYHYNQLKPYLNEIYIHDIDPYMNQVHIYCNSSYIRSVNFQLPQWSHHAHY